MPNRSAPADRHLITTGPRHARRTLLALIACLFFLALLVSAVRADDGPVDIAAKLDKHLSSIYPADEPGAAVLVVQRGDVVLRKGYGMANLEHDIRITPESVFRVGSMTKFFTATAILMLEEQGRLSLDDDITQYLPDYPTHGEKITIRHLVAHTSGIWDYLNLPKMQEGWHDDITPQGLINLFKDKPLEFKPGDGFAYSNSNYILLGVIIEKVSGQSYQDFVQEKIFTPAGMKSTRYGGHLPIIPNRAAGYEPSGDGGYNNARFLNMSEPYAAGGHVSTVDDLYRWDQAYLGGKLISKDTLGRALTRFRLNNGKEVPVACGCGISDFLGHRIIVYAGGIHGFATQAVIVPDEDLHVIVLSNNPRHPRGVSDVAADLTAIALGQPLAPPEPVTVDTKILESLAGTYRVPDDEGFLAHGGAEWVFELESGQLWWVQPALGRRRPLLPASDTEFHFDSGSRRHFEFVRDKHGNVSHVLLRLPLLYPQRAVRVTSP